MELIPLKAGPLRMEFDPHLAFLRYVWLGDVEVVRGIYVAVRDKAWNTVPFEVFDLEVGARDAHFSLAWMARCVSDEIAFEWRGAITGSKQGTISYQFDGEAQNSFLRNRIGICLLHPIRECAGSRCVVEHCDGTSTGASFPKWISPHQPFKNIRSIRHTVRPGVDVKVTLDGDVFEMEDQRNWTDSSFKTYSTPLEQAYPVRLAAGDRVRQSATIELLGAAQEDTGVTAAFGDFSNQRESSNDEVRIRVDWNAVRKLPAVGLSMAHPACDRPSDAAISRLKELGLDHLRVDLRLAAQSWRERLQDALQLAEQIGTQLELAVFCDSVREPAWRECLEALAEQRQRIARWLVLPVSAKATPTDLVLDAYQELLAFDPTIPLAFGTDRNFAELNRSRPTIPERVQVCYSVHPQMHASDNLSMRETLEGLPATVDSAYEYFHRDVVISPITLRPRFNSIAPLLTEGGEYEEPPVDERQRTGFAAAWTVGALSQLATHPHLASLTLFETHGPRGVMDSDGTPYAVQSVLSALSRRQQICTATSSRPLDVTALALPGGSDRRELIVGNTSGRRQSIVVETAEENLAIGFVEPESVRCFSSL